jgi:hypothetical protein
MFSIILFSLKMSADGKEEQTQEHTIFLRPCQNKIMDYGLPIQIKMIQL